MRLRRIVLFFFLLSLPVLAKEVTYRLTDAEPLTFTIPDDWSSGWGPMPFLEVDPDAPVDFLVFGKTPASDQTEMDGPLKAPPPRLMIDARKQPFPLSMMKQQLTRVDKADQKIIPPEPLHSKTDQTLIGYYNTQPSRQPGKTRMNAFWNLGARAWTANIKYSTDQTHWVATCVALIESARLADPETAPPTPNWPTMNGVKDPNFQKETMIKWRKHHD